MYCDKKVSAIIVAAGKGTRIGFDKMLYKIDGIPVVERSALLYMFFLIFTLNYLTTIGLCFGTNDFIIAQAIK